MDPILQNRVWSRLQAGVDEAESHFRGRALSPSLTSGETAACLFFPDGCVWVDGSASAPFQSALLSVWVSGLGGRLPTEPGQVYLSNDPYDGGGSLCDIKMVRAISAGSLVTVWMGVCGHYPDLGGRTLGGVAPEAESVHEEGFRVPYAPADEALLNLLSVNTRFPDLFDGDIQAQVSAIEAGCAWFEDLASTFGWSRVLEAGSSVRERSGAALVKARSELRDGTYVRRDRLDDGGLSDTFLPLEVEAEISDGCFGLNFSRSAESSSGPTNCTKQSVYAASLCGIRQIFPEVPACAFAIDDLEIRVPSGSLLDAVYPTPVGGTSVVLAERVASLVLEALSQAVHGRGRACDGGGGNTVVFEGIQGGRPFSARLVVGSGGGASGRGDGLGNTDPITHLSALPSLESFEQTYPIRIIRYAEREGSGGSGRYRGGEGTCLELEFLTRGNLTIYMDRFDRGAGGHHRGGRGVTSELEVLVGDRWESPPSGGRTQNLSVSSGDRVRVRTAGGGGYGHPYERAIRLVSEDVVSGRLTRKHAAKQHGVVYTSTDARDYDTAKTFKLRSYRLTSSDVDDFLDEIETLDS